MDARTGVVAAAVLLTLAAGSDAGQRQRSPGGSNTGGQGRSQAGAQPRGGARQGSARSAAPTERAQPAARTQRAEGARARRAEGRPAAAHAQSPARQARPERAHPAPRRNAAPPDPIARPFGGGTPDPIARPFGGGTPDPIARPFGGGTPDPIARPFGSGTPDPIARPFEQGRREADARARSQYRGPDVNTDRGGQRRAIPRPGPAPRRDYYRSAYRGYPRGRDTVYFYGYPRSYFYRRYPYGYGPAGRGLFYFDLHYNSYVWYPPTVVHYGTYGSFGYPTGELRIQVRPREAQVFVDGYYAGTVDDFDGVFQSLRLEAGDYRIQIVLPGYEPLDFDVRITPGERVNYKAELYPEQP